MCYAPTLVTLINDDIDLSANFGVSGAGRIESLLKVAFLVCWTDATNKEPTAHFTTEIKSFANITLG